MAGTALVCTLWPLAPAARAQTSTLVYGSDTIDIGNVTPAPLLGGESVGTYGGDTSDGSLGPLNAIQLGEPGSPAPNMGLDGNTTYGTLYDPSLVDINRGFVSRGSVELRGSNGISFVVKNPSSMTDYLNDAGIGTSRLNSSLHVDVIHETAYTGFPNAPANTYSISIETTSGQGYTILFARNSSITLDSSNQVFQIQYLPKFQVLNVYCGSRLALQATGINLKGLGIAAVSSGQTGGEQDLSKMGWVSGTERKTSSPAVLDTWSLGNNLVFGLGLGPNSYEDRFPFLTPAAERLEQPGHGEIPEVPGGDGDLGQAGIQGRGKRPLHHPAGRVREEL